mgnify:CR=1 FL=1
MKKILILLTLLFVPFIVNAKSNIEITNIELAELTDGMDEPNDPTYDGLKINFDLTFNKVGDKVVYKVQVTNNTDKDYEIEKGTKFSDGEYLKYDVSILNGSEILKAGEKKDINLTISYDKEVPADKFKNGKYSEQNAMTIDLSNGDEKNPYTASLPYVVVILAVIALVLLLVAFKKKKSLMLLLALILFVPVMIYALEKISIEIETNISIEKKTQSFDYSYYCVELDPNSSDRISGKLNIEYERGMTWEAFYESNYYNDLDEQSKQLLDRNIYYFLKEGYRECLGDMTGSDYCYNEYGTRYEQTSEIFPSSKGEYSIGGCR